MLEKLRKEKHTTGYHGTAADSAESILSGGFKESEDGVFFAPKDGYETAKYHAKLIARERGDPRFAVIEASFPKSRLAGIEAEGSTYDYVQVLGKHIGEIAVLGVEYFDTATTEVQIPESLRSAIESIHESYGVQSPDDDEFGLTSPVNPTLSHDSSADLLGDGYSAMPDSDTEPTKPGLIARVRDRLHGKHGEQSPPPPTSADPSAHLLK